MSDDATVRRQRPRGVPLVREAHLSETELLDLELDSLEADQQAEAREHLNVCAACRSQLEALHSATQIRDPLIGAQLGEYRIEAALARGGMGVVYRGVHPMIGKQVAIKVLLPEIDDGGAVNRLLDEARAVNSIRHPNIIDIFSFGSLPDGRHYFVMELLDGESIEELAQRRGRLTPDEVITVLEQSMSALGAAHGAGVIHRDLKPANLFLMVLPDKRWHLTVLDFGLAKRVGNTRQTSTNLVMGTPGFMAPEQIRGKTPVVQTDLYAMGVVAWVLLTGAMEVIAELKQLRGAPVARGPLARNPARKNPGQIPAGMPSAELQVALARRDAKTQPSMNAPAQEVPLRSRAPLWVVGALLALAGVGGIVAMLSRDVAPAPTPPQVFEKPTELSAHETAVDAGEATPPAVVEVAKDAGEVREPTVVAPAVRKSPPVDPSSRREPADRRKKLTGRLQQLERRFSAAVARGESVELELAEVRGLRSGLETATNERSLDAIETAVERLEGTR